MAVPDLGELNLDAMIAEDLLDVSNHLMVLAAYGLSKWSAMQHRGRGNIAEATRHERACDALYQRLPDNWRW